MFNWTLVLGRGVITGQLLNHPVGSVHLVSLTLRRQGSWGSRGLSNTGGWQAWVLQEVLYLLAFSLESPRNSNSIGSVGLIAAGLGHIAFKKSWNEVVLGVTDLSPCPSLHFNLSSISSLVPNYFFKEEWVKLPASFALLSQECKWYVTTCSLSPCLST